MADPFIREHIEELLTNIRSQVLSLLFTFLQCTVRLSNSSNLTGFISKLQVLIGLCVPYSRIYLSFLAEELRVKVEEVVVLLADLILDGALNAKIDEINGVLISESTNKATRCAAIAKCAKQLSSLHLSIVDRCS
ncbi:unnamed protein product [Brugia timori]|uniref:COP9 signalosome complex subunit 2 n=1 Tax=Brugia timori TaxID=42155 RepID=A0A0R3QHX2_9BILA|nr:unnamed protein product [Brugia timori]